MSTTTSIAQTVIEGAQVRIVYKDHADEITERVIDVERIYPCTSKGRCLVAAHCFLRNEYRHFDMARILFAMADTSTALVTFGPKTRPPGVPVPTTDLRMLLAVTGMAAWDADRAMQTAAGA
jgi:predicted DNA-binding transcriptional regulator YafY